MTSTPSSRRVDDHGPLADAAQEMTNVLGGLESQLGAGPSGSVWWPDHEYAKRIAHLGAHCSVALGATERGDYGSAFALLRTCLEHHLLDQLLFHARRYEQLVRDVDDVRFAEFEADLKAGTEPWTTNVHGLRREKDRVFVVRDGIEVKNGDGLVVGRLSPYYSLVKDHQPLFGKKSDQGMLDGGVIEHAQLRAHADRNEDLYRRFLSWGAIRRNLELNGLWSDLDLRRLDVHYRFLGAFVHATQHGYDILERWPAPDHHCSELILLYVTAIASREIDAFADYLDESQRSVLRGGEDIRRRTSWAAGQAAHLWFPGSQPHRYDLWREANRRGFLVARDLDPGLPALLPDQIGTDDIGYYSDPLDRVRHMHQSQNEMITGYNYLSPW